MNVQNTRSKAENEVCAQELNSFDLKENVRSKELDCGLHLIIDLALRQKYKASGCQPLPVFHQILDFLHQIKLCLLQENWIAVHTFHIGIW